MVQIVDNEHGSSLVKFLKVPTFLSISVRNLAFRFKITHSNQWQSLLKSTMRRSQLIRLYIVLIVKKEIYLLFVDL